MGAVISGLLTTVLGTLNTVLSLLAAIPVAGTVIAPIQNAIQAAITSITSALNPLNSISNLP